MRFLKDERGEHGGVVRWFENMDFSEEKKLMLESELVAVENSNPHTKWLSGHDDKMKKVYDCVQIDFRALE